MVYLRSQIRNTFFQQKFRFGIGSSQIKTKDTILTVKQNISTYRNGYSLKTSQQTGLFSTDSRQRPLTVGRGKNTHYCEVAASPMQVTKIFVNFHIGLVSEAESVHVFLQVIRFGIGFITD